MKIVHNWKKPLPAILLSFVATASLFGQTHPVTLAVTVSSQASSLYQQGIQLKTSAPSRALSDFMKAFKLAPDWEPPVYEIGVMLAVSHFDQSLPWLKKALAINPKDGTVWNVIGWGYYKKGQYKQAASAFKTQLHMSPGNPYAIWGLANCYGNSQVREYTLARAYLKELLHSPEQSSAAKMLDKLPPNAVDATYQPNKPISYEDAIAMALSFRAVNLTATASSITDATNAHPSASVAPYIEFATARGWLQGLSIPSFHAPATRLFIALFLAKEYGINQYDYVRPFALTDMASVPVNEQMVVNSMLAMRLMKEPSNNQFNPTGFVTRSSFSTLINNANRIMTNPPLQSSWLTPPAPPTKPAWLYFFRTGTPDIPTQISDFSAHQGQISALGFTDFPFQADTQPGSAILRKKIDNTSYLFTAMSAGPAAVNEINTAKTDGIQPYMVLSNYNYNTDSSNPQIVDQMLSSVSTSQSLANEAAQIVKNENLAGVTIDFENIWSKDRNALTAFIRELHQALTGTGAKVMVALPEQEASNPTSAYDYKGIGKWADLVMLITYDEHTLKSAPGAIANISNVTRVVQYAVQVIPPQKILLGLADYGYDWSTQNSSQITMSQAASLASAHGAKVVWDPATAGSHFTYTGSSGALHTVWYESGQSISALAKLVPAYGLKGYAAWYLGGEDPSFWNALTPYLPASVHP